MVEPPEDDLAVQHELDHWSRWGIWAGLVACVVYPLAVFVPMPTRMLTLICGASFGPALAFASMALGVILHARRKTVAAPVAALSNALAGALVTAMIVVQLAIQFSNVPKAETTLNRFVVTRLWDVVLGLDVSFDVFIGIGTAMFGFCMLKDPRFGRLVGVAGILVGVVFLLGFNFYTFPTPPKDAGLFDPGPVTGLWYLVVVLALIRWRRAESMGRRLPNA